MQALVTEIIPALTASFSTAPRQTQIVTAAPGKTMKKAATQNA
jgi:hypothetical protein